jgi:aminoglycoside/choline kinase family phosphotransferase
MADRAGLAAIWYRPGAGAGVADPAGLRALTDACRDVLEAAADGPPILALRDFHAQNLIWLPDRSGPARVGLLDFQDAMASHPVYDLVSLLEDARRDVPADLRAAMMARFAERSGMARPRLDAAAAVLGAQRALRILGVFARLSMHFDKPGYVALVPRVWAHLQRDLAHPAAAPLRAAVAAILPEPTQAALDSLRRQAGTCPDLAGPPGAPAGVVVP